MEPLRIRLSLEGASPGWATICLEKPPAQPFRLECSHTIDTLAQLAEAAADVAEHGSKSHVERSDDHEEWLITLAGKRNDLVLVVRKPLEFNMDNRGMATRKRWRLKKSRRVFEHEGEIVQSLKNIFAAFETAKNALGGPDAYRKHWGHPYPQEALDRLEAWLRARLNGPGP